MRLAFFYSLDARPVLHPIRLKANCFVFSNKLTQNISSKKDTNAGKSSSNSALDLDQRYQQHISYLQDICIAE